MLQTSQCVQKCTQVIRKDAPAMQTASGFFAAMHSQPPIFQRHSKRQGDVQNIPQVGGGLGRLGREPQKQAKQRSSAGPRLGIDARFSFRATDCRIAATGRDLSGDFVRADCSGLEAARDPAAQGRFSPMEGKWRPRRDLNPCRRRERPVSWARLDDGDARVTTAANRAFFVLQQRVVSKK